jgi:hypothetical protein
MRLLVLWVQSQQSDLEHAPFAGSAPKPTQRRGIRSLALCAMTEPRSLICFGRDVLPDAAPHLSGKLALKINRRKHRG